MAGINSLGVGSGVLTSDIIDKLRTADETTILDPLKSKIELSNQKEDAVALLDSLMTTFQKSTTALNSDSLYLARTTTGSTDAVSVTALDGTDIQSFSITDAVKAKNDVWTSKSVSSNSTAISGLGAGTLNLSLGGTDYAVAYTASSSLSDIRDSINETASDVMKASVLQVGTDSYQLVLTATDTNKAITFSDSLDTKQLDTITLTNNVAANDTLQWSDGTNSVTLDEATAGLTEGDTPTQTGVKMADAINADANLKLLYKATAVAGGFTVEALTSNKAFTGTTTSTGTQTSSEQPTTPAGTATNSLSTLLGLDDTATANIQKASAASFKYNGITITRDNNKITDLIAGVTIDINKDQVPSTSTTLTPGQANISITQDSTSISTGMSLLASSYNALISNLNDMTSADTSAGKAGIFNNESFVKSIKSDITNALLQTNSDNVSLINYGISLDKKGVMSFDISTFDEKFQASPTDLKTFFNGASATSTKQLNTVTLSGTTGASDTFKWSDGTNSITIPLTASQNIGDTGTQIADAINADSTLSALYTATATASGFTIESKTAGESFTGVATSTGTQTSSQSITTASAIATKAVTGVFETLDTKMTGYTGSNKLLSNFSDQLKTSQLAVTNRYDQQKASLDSRYEILTKKFIAYDAIISNLNNSFSALESAIKAQYVSN